MPTLQDGTIRAEVAAPVAVPYRFGLFSVAVPQPTTETRWEAGGITWVSELCTQPGFTTNACVDPDVAALANPDTTNCVVPVFDPFTVYTVVDPSAGKMSADVAATTARNRLAAVEQFGVEA